jgi:hypothetical protein
MTTEPGLDKATVTRLLLSNALLCCTDDDETAPSTQSFTLLPAANRLVSIEECKFAVAPSGRG